MGWVAGSGCLLPHERGAFLSEERRPSGATVCEEASVATGEDGVLDAAD